MILVTTSASCFFAKAQWLPALENVGNGLDAEYMQANYGL